MSNKKIAQKRNIVLKPCPHLRFLLTPIHTYNTQSSGNEKLVSRLGLTKCKLYLYLRKGVVGSENKTPIYDLVIAVFVFFNQKNLYILEHMRIEPPHTRG